MAKPGERKAGRTCRYVTADGRYWPAVIVDDTGVDEDPVDVRISGTDIIFAAVSEMSDPSDTEVWLPGSRRRYDGN